MTTAATDTDLAKIQDDLATLKRDFATLVEHAKQTATGAGTGAVNYLSDEAQRIYRNVAEEGRRHATTVSRQVEEQPLTSVLIAFGIGFIASRLLSR